MEDIVEKNIESDLNSQEVIKNLDNEIKYRIIESLPNAVSAKDIKIDTTSIVKWIKLIQENNKGDHE
jgi:hypothetical protein